MDSPFSFHCMICFEEFDIETRYPVVLPCGHTYVCNQCTERLDKCMECRTSLVTLIPRAAVGDNQHHARSGGRWGPNRSPGAPPQPPIKKRLPLPKNVVLMSLIEATELAAESVRSQEQRPSLSDSPNLSIPNAVLDIEEEEEERIKTGTSLAISDCGTYAIAAKEGLEIYPSRPDTLIYDEQEVTEGEAEVDSLVRFFHLDQKIELSESEDHVHSRSDHKENAPVWLGWGDRVQIVSTEYGWAKLARGYGFVRADRNRLVKVGSSVDRACKLEALLRLLSSRRKELRAEQKRVDNQFISLMNELQVSLMSDEDLTVIAADAFHEKKKCDYVEDGKLKKLDLEQPLSGEVYRHGEKHDEDSTLLKPRPMERPVTPPHAIESSRSFFCSSSDVFKAVLPLAAGEATQQQPRPLPHSTQTPAIVDHLRMANSNTSTDTAESTPSRNISPAYQLSPRALRAGARAWREMHGKPYGDVLTGIDFRTGMSGHTALTTASSNPHDYLNPRMGSVFRGGFSNHSGLTVWKKKSNRGPSLGSHLAMPMISGAYPDDVHGIAGASTQTP